MLGASLASFFGVLAERPLRNESIGGRSHCACGRLLKAHENIPVFGWLKARGRATCCGAELPVRYIASEAFLGVIFGIVGLQVLKSYLAAEPLTTTLTVGIAAVVLACVGTFISLRAFSKAELKEHIA